MKKTLVLLALFSNLAFARHNAHGFCEQGAIATVTAGIPSTTNVQGSFPSCTVTVYLTGTLTLATLYADNVGTSLANPFTANSSGFWLWYADNNRYDVVLSGGGLPSSWKITDILLFDPVLQTPAVTSVSAGTGISVTGPATTPTVNNTGVLGVTAGGAGISITGTGANPVVNNTGVTSYNARVGAVLPLFADTFPGGSQAQQLQIQPNTGNNTTLQWISPVTINPSIYAFPAQSPGGSLSVGSNTITFTPCPLGVNGSDTNHNLYVSGGVGTAESVPITGGTCTSGASTGTIIITAANTHSGAWTVQGVAGGISEAIVANPGAVILVNSSVSVFGPVGIVNSETLQCASGATLTWSGASGANVLVIQANNVRIRDCTMVDGTAGIGIADSGTHTDAWIENNKISGGAFGISLALTSRLMIVNNRFSGYTNTAIAMQTTNINTFISVLNNDVDNTGCTVVNCGAISLFNVSHVVISNNRVTVGGNQDGGLFVGPTNATDTDIAVTGNVVKGNGSNALECGNISAANFVHANNVCDFSSLSTNPGIGWEFNQASSGIISGDRFIGGVGATTAMHSFYLESTNNVLVTGISATNWGTTGDCVFLQLTTLSLGMSNNKVMGAECLAISTYTGAGLKLDTLTVGAATVANNAFIGNHVFGSTTFNFSCVIIANSGSATESNLVVKDNILNNCSTGVNSSTTTAGIVSIENNTILGSSTNNINVQGNANSQRIIDTNGGTATAVAGAASINNMIGTITSESLTTAAGATYTLTLSITPAGLVNANTIVFTNTFLGTSSAGTPQIVGATPSTNTLTIVVKNIHATNAFNGTIKIQYQASNN